MTMSCQPLIRNIVSCFAVAACVVIGFSMAQPASADYACQCEQDGSPIYTYFDDACSNHSNDQSQALGVCRPDCSASLDPGETCNPATGQITAAATTNTSNTSQNNSQNSPSNFNDSAYRNAAQSVFIPANCAGDQYNNECSVCDIFQLLINVSRVILALTGVAAVLMLILAGFLFITAYGDTSRISQGKEIIKAVIVGVFVIMIAWTLVNTVIISLTNGAFNTSTLISGNLQCEATPKKN